MSKNQISEGVFLSFTPEEAEKVWSWVQEDGYEAAKEGMKAWILSFDNKGEELEEETNSFDSLLKKGSDYFQKNPEQLKLIKQMGSQLGAQALKKIFKIF